jgi:hypothetical protein
MVALVARWSRIGARARRRLLVSLVVADFAFFGLATSTVLAPVPTRLEPTHSAAAAVLGTNGRFAIVNTTVTHLFTLDTIGQPDLNAFTRLESVQGYGSILSDRYGAATGSHELDTLSACALESGRFHALRLTTLLASPGDLAVRVGPRTTVRAPSSSACPQAPRPGSAHRRAFYLGSPVALRSVTLVKTGASQTRGAPVVDVVAPGGGVRRPRETVRRTAGGWSVRFDTPITAAGIVVEGPAREIADNSTVRSVSGARWALDGRFQDAIDTSTWRFAGTFAHTFGIFRRTAPPPPPVWLVPATAGSSVHQLSAPDWGGATDRVVARRPVTVVWSESYLPGWHATLVPANDTNGRQDRSLSLVVYRRGLLQAVEVPAGAWILTFHYRPPLLTLGMAGSVAAVAGFLLLLVVLVASRWRRRGRRGQASEQPVPAFAAESAEPSEGGHQLARTPSGARPSPGASQASR